VLACGGPFTVGGVSAEHTVRARSVGACLGGVACVRSKSGPVAPRRAAPCVVLADIDQCRVDHKSAKNLSSRLAQCLSRRSQRLVAARGVEGLR
jgi:hypothetical protein